jgi:plastocyanin
MREKAMITKRKVFALMMALMLAIAISCGDPEDDGPEPGDVEEDGTAAETLPKYQSKGDEGTITGKVIFEGEAPKQPTLQMDADTYCKSNNAGATAETVVVNDGKVQNVIVYIKDGNGVKYTFDVSTEEVTIDQKGCQYKPHVVSMMTKQKLKVLNSDDTNHNVHPLPKTNKEWNESQAPKGEPLIKDFARAEVIPVKCNIHPWMKAYLGVFDHPFHAVSKADGTFEIKGVPPGDYTVEAWHEKMTAQTQKVTVAAKESKSVDFTFKAEMAKKSAEENGVKLGAPLIVDMGKCCGAGVAMVVK